MPATYKDNGGSVNGSNKVFTYDFPTLQTEDVKVALNGVTQATTKYTVSLSPANITFNNTSVDSSVQETDGSPKSGVTVKVYRETVVGKANGDEDPKAVFAAGSSIRAGDLNANVEQALFAIHELQEQEVQTESVASGAVTSAKIEDGTIVNANVNASAAIAGTKVSPNFGSQAVVTTGTLASGATTVTGNITVSGTVDGRDVAADGSKLDGVETGATADQTGAQIKSAYEGESNTNAYTDAEKSKLAGITASANNYSLSSDLLDEDNMSSNSATKAASQQSIKAYVDSKNSEITVQDEGSNLSTAATTLNFTGSGVTASGTGATKTITISGGGGGGAGVTTDFQFLELKAHNNASGAFSAGAHDYELVTKGSTTAVTPTQAAALLISIGGVIQQPQPNQGDIGAAGNGSDGFALDGSSIHFGANLTAHPEYILYLKGSGVATVAANSITGDKIALGSDASGDIMYYNGTDYVRLAKGSDGEVLKLASGAPSWAADAGGMSNIVEDTSPQLGGALDVQAQEINTSTTNGNIKLTPNGTGVVEVKGNTNPGTIQLNCENNSHGVKIKGPAHSAAASYTLTLPDDDGTVDQVLKTDGSGNLSWGANVVIWTLGINGGADAYTFTGPGFASATDDPILYLSRGQTYKFINGNSAGTHAFNIEKSDHDGTWSAYTTGMTGAGATGGNTMTWTVPMDAPSLLKYVSGTTSGMTGFIQVTDGTNTDEGFSCWTGSRVSGLQIDNGPNGSHMAFFGTHPSGYQPTIIGSSGTTTTFQSAAGYDFDSGNINLQSYGTNTTTPATIKFEGGGSNNTYGVTISGPATAQATSNYTITLPGVVPTSNGQVLSATTAGVCSWADGVVINNQAANRLTTIGSTTTELDGEANLTFDGSTLALTGNQTATLAVQAQGYEAPATVTANWSIAAANNAFFPGPMTVDSGVTVTVPAGRTLTIV